MTEEMYTFTRQFLHDLRSSLGVIMLSATGITPDDNQANRDRLLNLSRESILEQTVALAKLIEHTDRIFALHYNKIETRPALINLAEYTNQVVSERNTAMERWIHFYADCDELWLEIDPLRYREALIYLFDSVEAFSQAKDRIEVRLTCCAGETGTCLVISDPTADIPEECQAALFKPLTRMRLSANTCEQGSGLGLYLAKLIIEELLHGTVAFKVGPQSGASFEIHLQDGAIGLEAVRQPEQILALA